MVGPTRTSKRWLALACGVSALLGASHATAANSWALVYSEVNNGNAVMSISALNATTAWAVGISTQGSNQSPAGWRTTNGVGWAPMALPAGGGGAMEFTIPTQIAFLDDNTGWLSGIRVSPAAGQLNLIWRTTSGGMSWDQLHQAPDEIKHLQVTHDWAMFAVGGTTVVRTLDGVAFVETQPSLPSGMGLVGVHMFNKDCGYALAAPTEESALGHAVLWTSDGGATWTTRSENREYRLERAWFVSASQGWAVGSRGLEGVLARTTDGGKTWTTSKAPNHPPFMNQEPPVTSCEDVRFFDDRRGIALCLCCTGGCEGEEGSKPSYMTALLRTSDGGQTWTMDPDYEAKMSAPPFPEMSKVSGMFSMSFPDPNNGFMAGQNNLILRYTADAPEADAWAPPECSSGTSGSGGGSSSSGGSSGNEAAEDGGEDAGCGCRVASSSSPGAPLALLLLGAAIAHRRRRTRPS